MQPANLRFGRRAAAVCLAAAVCVSAFGQRVIDARMVVAQGDVPPGSGGFAVSGVNAPFTNGNGNVGFTGTTSGGPNFVWYDDQIVWLNTDDTVNTVTGAEGTMGISDAGGFIYSPAVNGLDAVYTNHGVLLKDDDPAPGFPGMFNTFNSRPIMLPDGTAYWMAGITATLGGTTSNRCLYRCTDTLTPVISVVFAGGDVFDGFTLSTGASNFTYDISDNGLHHIHEVVTTAASNNTFLYIDGGLPYRVGNPTGGGENWASFGSLSINDAGKYVFSADTSAATSMDEVIVFNGAIVLREGQTVDGVQLGGGGTGATLRWVSINNRDQVCHIWGWGTGASLREHVFVGDAADLGGTSRNLLGVGDHIDVDGDGVADFQVFDLEASATISPGVELAENGFVYVEVGLGPIGGAETTNAIIRLAGVGLKADCNCDGTIDFFDIDPFLLALFNPAVYESTFPKCDHLNGDVNDDGSVDFFDIDPFLDALFG